MENSFQTLLKKYEKVIGAAASLLAILMFLSIIEVLLANLRGESKIIIQPAATALSGFVWSLYGYSKKDLFIMVPNLIALVLGMLTVISALV